MNGFRGAVIASAGYRAVRSAAVRQLANTVRCRRWLRAGRPAGQPSADGAVDRGDVQARPNGLNSVIEISTLPHRRNDQRPHPAHHAERTSTPAARCCVCRRRDHRAAGVGRGPRQPGQRHPQRDWVQVDGSSSRSCRHDAGVAHVADSVRRSRRISSCRRHGSARRRPLRVGHRSWAVEARSDVSMGGDQRPPHSSRSTTTTTTCAPVLCRSAKAPSLTRQTGTRRSGRTAAADVRLGVDVTITWPSAGGGRRRASSCRPTSAPTASAASCSSAPSSTRRVPPRYHGPHPEFSAHAPPFLRLARRRHRLPHPRSGGSVVPVRSGVRALTRDHVGTHGERNEHESQPFACSDRNSCH